MERIFYTLCLRCPATVGTERNGNESWPPKTTRQKTSSYRHKQDNPAEDQQLPPQARQPGRRPAVTATSQHPTVTVARPFYPRSFLRASGWSRDQRSSPLIRRTNFELTRRSLLNGPAISSLKHRPAIAERHFRFTPSCVPASNEVLWQCSSAVIRRTKNNNNRKKLSLIHI